MRRELNIQLIVMSNYEIRNDNDLKLWFRIKSIQKKIDKLGPMYSKGLIGQDGTVLKKNQQCMLHSYLFTKILSKKYFLDMTNL